MAGLGVIARDFNSPTEPLQSSTSSISGQFSVKRIDIFGLAPARNANQRMVHISKPSPPPGFGFDYFDNPDFIGYGGYKYDGRYKSAAAKFLTQFSLGPGCTVLEIGCAKGFILYEFHLLGLEVAGLDASEYAVSNAMPAIKDKLRVHSAPDLPFSDRAFDFVLAKEVLPHLIEVEALKLITEIMRVGKESFLEIQCANNIDSATLMKKWDQTHQTIKSEEWWVTKLEELGYKGAFNCRELF